VVAIISKVLAAHSARFSKQQVAKLVEQQRSAILGCVRSGETSRRCVKKLVQKYKY
jgi:hypothetical protein